MTNSSTTISAADNYINPIIQLYGLTRSGSIDSALRILTRLESSSAYSFYVKRLHLVKINLIKLRETTSTDETAILRLRVTNILIGTFKQYLPVPLFDPCSAALNYSLHHNSVSETRALILAQRINVNGYLSTFSQRETNAFDIVWIREDRQMAEMLFDMGMVALKGDLLALLNLINRKNRHQREVVRVQRSNLHEESALDWVPLLPRMVESLSEDINEVLRDIMDGIIQSPPESIDSLVDNGLNLNTPLRWDYAHLFSYIVASMGTKLRSAGHWMATVRALIYNGLDVGSGLNAADINWSNHASFFKVIEKAQERVETYIPYWQAYKCFPNHPIQQTIWEYVSQEPIRIRLDDIVSQAHQGNAHCTSLFRQIRHCCYVHDQRSVSGRTQSMPEFLNALSP